MNFQHYSLGHRSRGEVVVVTLSGNAANVRLMDSSNFQSYRSGRRHQYIGGLARRSPVRLQIPRSGQWHVTIDLQGLRGRVQSAIRVEPNPLPDIQEQPLASVPSLVRDHNHPPQTTIDSADERDFDVFISHASEDKNEVVRPLAEALRQGGLDVWYDEFELKIGDSLRRKIDSGLARSRVGIVGFSKDLIRE